MEHVALCRRSNKPRAENWLLDFNSMEATRGSQEQSGSDRREREVEAVNSTTLKSFFNINGLFLNCRHTTPSPKYNASF